MIARPAAGICYKRAGMDEAAKSEFRELGEEADALMDAVELALDELAPHSQKLETRAQVETLSARYRERIGAYDSGDPDRWEVERRIGRKIVDLQKLAMSLPAPPQGKPAEQRASNEFFATREGKSSRKPFTPGVGSAGRAAEGKRYSVSGDVEAWCGPCNDLKTHTIVAMVGDEPAQVVCQVCNSKHKFRLEPARGKKAGAGAGAGAATPSGRTPSSTSPPPSSKMDEKNAFINELRMADSVRPFSPKERYKSGEIIEHPEFGRGRIENALPNSLLVRFAAGLRPVKLG